MHCGAGKLAGASSAFPEVSGDALCQDSQDEHTEDTIVQISNKNSLIWVTPLLNGQVVPAMVDSGANPNCISLRCVQASPHLKRLARLEYSGKQIVNANGEPIEPSFVIQCELKIGTPQKVITTKFVAIKSLPFSCILGQETLGKFSSWEVSNTNKLLTIDKIHVVPFTDCGNTSGSASIELITSQKTTIPPYSSAVVDARAFGPALEKFRPTSNINVVVEGNLKFCDRLSIEVLPSINVLTHQNCGQKLIVHNLSQKAKTISKGVKIAECSTDYELCDSDTIGVNLISERDPIDLICDKITDLSPSELRQARELLRNYKDVFTVSSSHIGHTNIQTFDVSDDIRPVQVPLRRIPFNHKEIIQQLIEKYEQLHLLEPIESPFRAATVLVKKKNPSNSTDVSDMYRLCTDYRLLNNSLTSSGFPSPSIDDCLDAVGDSDMFSSVDFNNGYFQIPCTERAKRVLAFSPGYGFNQYTWKVMPQGIKTASSTFQEGVMRTFKGHKDRILPAFYDDVTVKSKGFKQHLENVKVILNDVRAAQLTLNALKCSFFQRKINYLGHVISKQSIEIDPERIKAITTLPAPHDTRSLRRLI